MRVEQRLRLALPVPPLQRAKRTREALQIPVGVRGKVAKRTREARPRQAAQPQQPARTSLASQLVMRRTPGAQPVPAELRQPVARRMPAELRLPAR